MSSYSVDLHTKDGRLRGCYLYMLMCHGGDAIYVRLGHLSDPFAKLKSLIRSAPIEAQMLFTAEIDCGKVKVVESDLRREFKPWHSHRDWHYVAMGDRPKFNVAWRCVFARHSPPSRPLCWSSFSIVELLRDAKVRRVSAAQRRQLAARRVMLVAP